MSARPSTATALMSTFLILILSSVSSPVLAAGPSPNGPGEHRVGHHQTLVVDAARANRQLPLWIWYPADADAWNAKPAFTFFSLFFTIGITSTASKDDLPVAGGQFPLVIFSHGYGSIPNQSFKLMEHLASHGFVVVSIEHTGNIQGDTSSLDPEADRYPDVAFTIGEMDAMNADAGSLFYGHVDATNTGVVGHSYGGMTSMFMAAGHDGFPADPRVKAIMPIAASSSALTDSEIAGITIPTLFLVGSLDGLQAETIRSFGLVSSAPDLFRVDVVGANHTHFANVCDIGDVLIGAGFTIDQWPSIGASALIGPYNSTCVPPAFDVDEAIRIQNLYAAAHFRAYLLGETEYYSYLRESYAEANEPDVIYFGSGPLLEPTLPGLGIFGGIGLALAIVSFGYRRSSAGSLTSDQ